MKDQRLSLDIITTLPGTIIENILCLLPIKEAARTSILSREWRYKWTKITKLVFFQTTVKSSIEERHLSNRRRISDLELERRNKEMNRKLLYVIHQVLLQRQGPIHEFTLSMEEADETCFGIDQIILHLSRNHTLKKLTLDFYGYSSYRLPFSVFTLPHLTELYLDSFEFVRQPTFNRISSLTTLSLKRVMISGESLVRLLSNCPSLKSLCLVILDENIRGNKYLSIMELFKCVPGIEHLTTGGYIVALLVKDSVPEELQTSLLHLKYLCIEDLYFGAGYGLTFLGALMKCSPNLEKIKLQINDSCDKKESVKVEEYSDLWLEHLNELEIENFRNFKLVLDFVKFILARSPNLKKVILLINIFDWREESEMLTSLLRAPRVSLVEIIVEDRLKCSDDEDYIAQFR